MNKQELVKQFITLLDYLIDNYNAISDEDFESIVLNLTAILDSNYKDEYSSEEIMLIHKMLDEGCFEILTFYKAAHNALIKSLAHKEEVLAKENMVSTEKIQLLTEEIKKKNGDIELYRYRFIHLYNIREIYNKKYQEEEARFKGKGILYSAITGGYDEIIEPEYVGDLEYILLTDKAPKGYKGKWQIREIPNPDNLPANRFARYLKMHPYEFFPDYDWSVYIDGKQKIVGDFREYVRLFGKKSGMICFPHYDTNTLKAQADAIISNKKAPEQELIRQLENYKKRGYKDKGYMAETACIVRDHHDEKLKKVMDDWWKEIISYNHNRDQMSFDYVCWKNDYDYDLCNHLVYNNPWCIGEHVHK